MANNSGFRRFELAVRWRSEKVEDNLGVHFVGGLSFQMTIPSRVNYQKLCDHLIRRIRIRDETVQDSVVITGFT
ncbi:unnamed protein product, partial [Linum tenue]